MAPRPPVLRALLGVVARPALLASAAAIGVAGVLAAIVLGQGEPTDPARPTPIGTAILAPSDRELGLLQTPTPQPTRVPAEADATAVPTEPSEPQPTPTPRVVLAPTALPRPTTAAPTAPAAESTAPPAETNAPAAEVAQAVETAPSPTPLPNVRVTPTPTPPPPPPPADLPPAEVLEPVDLAPEPTRAPRQDREPAPEEADADGNRPDAEGSRRDAPPTPTAIRIVPGGPPDREPGGAARAGAPEGAAAVQSGDLGEEIQARVTGALNKAGITEGNGRGDRPVGLPAQTAEPDEPVQTIVLPPIEPSGGRPRAAAPTPRPAAIAPRNPRPRARPTTTARPPVEVPLPPSIAPRQPGGDRSPGQPGGRGNDDDSPFCDGFPFCDEDD